jgi:hypothetical protein
MPPTKAETEAYEKELQRLYSQAKAVDAAAAQDLARRLDQLKVEMNNAFNRAVARGTDTRMQAASNLRWQNEIGKLMDQFRKDWGVSVDDSLTDVLEIARLSATSPLAKAGFPAVNLRMAAAQLTPLIREVPNIIQGITDPAKRAIWSRSQAVLRGTETADSYTRWLDGYLRGFPERYNAPRFGQSFAYQAERIYRTESLKALNFGHALSLEELHRSGPDWVKQALVKTWWHGIGGRQQPRENHIQLQLTTQKNPVPIDEPFKLGPHRPMAPHDPVLPPGESINCGCTLVTSVSPNFGPKDAK